MKQIINQCPECQGTGAYTNGLMKGNKTACLKCQGTGIFYAPDPTTAGSEPSAGPSRRRSLPVPGIVQDSIRVALVESAFAWKWLHDHDGHPIARLVWDAFEALGKVQSAIAEVNREAPEGNT